MRSTVKILCETGAAVTLSLSRFSRVVNNACNLQLIRDGGGGGGGGRGGKHVD